MINGVPGGTAMTSDEVAQLLRPLVARLGVFAVLGNHDWWNNGEEVKRSLIENEIQLLENQSITLQISAPGPQLA